MREPYFVPSYIKVNVLFKDMKATNNQLPFLLMNGGSVGIVTLKI